MKMFTGIAFRPVILESKPDAFVIKFLLSHFQISQSPPRFALEPFVR